MVGGAVDGGAVDGGAVVRPWLRGRRTPCEVPQTEPSLAWPWGDPLFLPLSCAPNIKLLEKIKSIEKQHLIRGQ